MAKKIIPEKKKEEKSEVEKIDKMPKYYQQPRSSPPKRRTDFSTFFSLPSNLDKWDSSSSASSTENGELETRKGKRARKPRLHFDELIFPFKSSRKVRRFRIMRYLGLTPPIGSPF